MAPQPDLLAKMQAMSELIDATIQTVRRISTELRPGILDLGLVATTLSYALFTRGVRDTAVASVMTAAPRARDP